MFFWKRFAGTFLLLIGFALLVTACMEASENTQIAATEPATVTPTMGDEQDDPQPTAVLEDEVSSSGSSREEGSGVEDTEKADTAPTRLPADRYADLEIVTLLPQDAIPAIDNPRFLPVMDADDYYDPDELVIGVDFNGEARAYSVPYLSNHEIVNDNVGGVKIAVTW